MRRYGDQSAVPLLRGVASCRWGRLTAKVTVMVLNSGGCTGYGVQGRYQGWDLTLTLIEVDIRAGKGQGRGGAGGGWDYMRGGYMQPHPLSGLGKDRAGGTIRIWGTPVVSIRSSIRVGVALGAALG